MSAESELGARVISKVTWRLIPFIFACYVVAYLDRVNIGFAGKAFQADLKLSDQVFGYGASLFFWGYFLFEIPSNLLLEKVGARVWIARIMIMWGLASVAMAWIQGTWSFYGMRFLLGVMEAGFFPGVVLYLTYWVPARFRAKTSALFMAAVPVAMGCGAPLSGWLMDHPQFGFKGWQWLFIVEGLPAIVMGLLALKVLTSRPEQATWLTREERVWLEDEMARERAARVSAGGHAGWGMLKDPKVLLLCAIYFLQAFVTYGVFIWLPKILGETTGLGGLKLGLVTAIPFAAALVGMIWIGAHSDRTGERKLHVAVCAAAACLGLVGAALSLKNPVLLVLSITLCQVGQRALMAVFWSIPPAFLAGTAAAAGIAFINSIGNAGGGVGPGAIGWVKDHFVSGYKAGLFMLAGAMALLAVLVLCIRMPKAKAP